MILNDCERYPFQVYYEQASFTRSSELTSMVNTPDFVYTKVSCIRFSLWPFDTSQQVKSVIPKYSHKQNRDQRSRAWLSSGNQQSLIAYRDAHQIQWDRSQLNPTALVGYHCYYTRPRLHLGLV